MPLRPVLDNRTRRVDRKHEGGGSPLVGAKAFNHFDLSHNWFTFREVNVLGRPGLNESWKLDVNWQEQLACFVLFCFFPVLLSGRYSVIIMTLPRAWARGVSELFRRDASKR